MRRPQWCAIVAAFTLLAVVACSWLITDDVERAWQENMSEALVPGYTAFKGLEVDGDIAWYLFSYRLPSGYDPAAAVPQLKAQIQRSRGCFTTVLETPTELQMRCNIMTYGEPGYDEWRILVDPSRRKVTAMFGNLDSPVERESYPLLLDALKRGHARE